MLVKVANTLINPVDKNGKVTGTFGKKKMPKIDAATASSSFISLIGSLVGGVKNTI